MTKVKEALAPIEDRLDYTRDYGNRVIEAYNMRNFFTFTRFSNMQNYALIAVVISTLFLLYTLIYFGMPMSGAFIIAIVFNTCAMGMACMLVVRAVIINARKEVQQAVAFANGYEDFQAAATYK